MTLIFKIVPRAEWEAVSDSYGGSAHDRTDGFLHFSTARQLPDTLRLYYAGQSDLVLVAVDPEAVAASLKYEHSASRNEDFPHLFTPLPRAAVLWVRDLSTDSDGQFVLPTLV